MMSSTIIEFRESQRKAIGDDAKVMKAVSDPVYIGWDLQEYQFRVGSSFFMPVGMGLRI